MIRDPLVEEIHQIRQKLLEDCDGRLDKLMDRYQAAEEQDRDRLVTLDSLRARREQQG
jgi:ribosomal 50S subunit-associated protein YjgA (DUF615 family)